MFVEQASGQGSGTRVRECCSGSLKLGWVLTSRGFLADAGLFAWVGVLAGGLRGLAAQKFVVRLPSFWGWFLCGLVLGESGSSRRGIRLEHFRDAGGLV